MSIFFVKYIHDLCGAVDAPRANLYFPFMTNAGQIIQDAGLRPTANRLAVLEALLQTDNPLTHQELLDTLARSHDFDRVTLYRVLDWLLTHDIVHKIMGENRAWRFQLNRKNASHHHAHFECSDCGKVYCLENTAPSVPPLPAGFRVESMELTIRGLCNQCRSDNIAHKNT